MKQAVNEALISESIFDYEKMKEVACTYSAKQECSVHEAVYLVILELWLCLMFSRVIFLNSNWPEKQYKTFKGKNEIDELPHDNTDLFQRNMYDCYLNQPSESVKNGLVEIISNFIWRVFISLLHCK